MDCLEFRRAAGGDPQHTDAAAREHAAACPRCAEYLQRMLTLDARILDALRVPVTGTGPGVASSNRRRASAALGLGRTRWMALAASIVGGVLVGTLLWVGGPRNSLARDLLLHMEHEPQALVATERPAENAALGRVLERGGIRLRPEVPLVSYANSCRFRGHTVPHLVVQTADGPVTVMVLRNERAVAPVSFDEQGYAGRIMPAGPGSIAVIGADGADLDGIAARVLAAVEWLDD